MCRHVFAWLCFVLAVAELSLSARLDLAALDAEYLVAEVLSATQVVTGLLAAKVIPS